MALVIMGVSGSGKTSVGRLLAKKLGYEFLDADDFHSEHNVAKMASGQPLTDADRAPWLEAIRDAMCERLRRGDGSTVECEVTVTSFPTQSGETHICAVLRDVTATVELVTALADSEARWRATVDNAPIGIAVSDATGRTARIALARATAAR